MTERVKEYRYSEIFSSVQGEGKYTGVPTVWLRLFGCNFECAGFGQKDPTNPITWKLDYKDLNVDDYKSMEELPVFKTGCDSSYSWSKKFHHLAHKDTAENIARKLTNLMVNDYNPSGSFWHETSKQNTHLAFTGGEPMLQQNAVADVFMELTKQHNQPLFITIETNGTQPLNDWFIKVFRSYIKTNKLFGVELFWSISPKLYLSGEHWSDAIKPEVIKQYHTLSPYGQLKFVCDSSVRAWAEIEAATSLYRAQGIDFPVCIMPVGGTREDQENIQARICDETIKRGYTFSPRVHCWIYGNVVGK